MNFIQDNGFDFSKEEFGQVKSDLSEEELDRVTGGDDMEEIHFTNTKGLG